jgi:predicted lactoylglutathione lyase
LFLNLKELNEFFLEIGNKVNKNFIGERDENIILQ